MKKLIIAAVLSLLSLTAFAETGLKVNGGVGLTTNYIYRGETLSNKGPSAGADVGAVYTLDKFSLFGNGRVDSVNQPANEISAIGRGEVGVGFDAWRLKLQTGVRETMNWGGVSSIGAQPVDPKDMNYREWFVRGAANLLGGTATASYDRMVKNPLGGTGHDAFTTVGYDYPIFAKTSVGALVGWKTYDTANVTKYNNTELNVRYALTKQVGLYAASSLGGQRADGVRVPNLVSAGLKYSF